MTLTNAKNTRALHRTVVALATLFLAVVFAFSSFCFASSIGHECAHSETCSVCISSQSLKGLTDALKKEPSAATTLTFFASGLALAMLLWLANLYFDSLIYLKIRLNN